MSDTTSTTLVAVGLAKLMGAVTRDSKNNTAYAVAYAKVVAAIPIGEQALTVYTAFKYMLERLGGIESRRFSAQDRRTLETAKTALSEATAIEAKKQLCSASAQADADQPEMTGVSG